MYWYAYPRPITCYAIAKKIYKPVKGRPDTAKIYPYARAMADEKVLNVIDKKYQSNPEPLVEEIEKMLGSQKPKISLTEDERLCILSILQNKFFKGIISSAIEKETGPIDIDAAREISHILGVSSIPLYRLHKSLDARARALARKQHAEYKGYIDQKVKEPKSQKSMDQFYYYFDRPNLLSKLIRLLPIDLEKFWEAMEEAKKRIEKVEEK